MDVRAVMNPRVKFCGLKTTLAEAARIMGDNDCGALPVVDDEKKVLGMITDRDICLAMASANRFPSEIPVEQVMSKQVYACGPDEKVGAALQTMQNRKVRRLPVTDGDSKLVGILSMDDIVLRGEGYGRTIKTLQAIYKRPGPGKQLVV